jgi:signal peptidase I
VTESVLIYFLFVLTIVRLILFLEPANLRSMDVLRKTKLKDVVDAIVWAGVVALLLIHFVVRSFYIPSESMLGTLQVDDFILVNEFIYDFTDPNRGDIVVFHPPPTYTGPNSDLIKRVVAVEHDVVEIKDGQLLINGIEIDEPFIAEPMNGSFPSTVVQEDHIFVLGDNRNYSRDSRLIGQIPLVELVGRAELIFFPLNRVSQLK